MYFLGSILVGRWASVTEWDIGTCFEVGADVILLIGEGAFGRLNGARFIEAERAVDAEEVEG